MASQLFVVSDTNPNQVTGCGGCVCAEASEPDCKPPFVVFTNCDTDDPRRPRVVVCETCLKAAAEAVEGEALSVGEPAGEYVEPESPNDASDFQITGIGPSVDGENPEEVFGKEASDE
jgi:hypothetical protein